MESYDNSNCTKQRRKKFHHHYQQNYNPIFLVVAVVFVVAASTATTIINDTMFTQWRNAGSAAESFSKTSSPSSFSSVDAFLPTSTIVVSTIDRRSSNIITKAKTKTNTNNHFVQRIINDNKKYTRSRTFSYVKAKSGNDDNDDDKLLSSSSSSLLPSYDMVVVGGGSAGLTAAKFASGTLKKSVLIIEEERLGGDCTWTGCVPSKSLIASAKAAKMATNYAIQHSNKNNNNNNNIDDENNNDDDTHHRKKIRANFDQVRTYFQEKQESIYEADDSPKALKKYGIDTTEGRKACLTSPTTLSFLSNDCDDSDSKRTTTIVEAKDGILLCTGAKPNRPTSKTIPGLSDIDYLTYEEIWTRDFGGDGTLPNRWTVIGGGPIGCELAQALSRLGAQVTIVTGSSGRLLSNVDDVEVSQLMKEVFEEDENIKVVSGRLSKVEPSINKNDDNDRKTSRHVAYVKVKDSDETDGQQEVTVEGDVMLLSIGRIPNTEGLGLETVGIDIDEITGGIVVNDSLQTTVEGIYAAGDCTGDKQFTHYAGYQGAVAARNILLPFTDPGKLGNDVPAATFTSPEVATIGYSEKSAKAEFGEKAVGVSKLYLDEVDRAICDGSTKGFIKVIYSKRGKKKILGATIMAPVAGELIGEISVAMKAGMTWPNLAKAVHPYPSYAFALQSMAAEVYYEEVGKYRWVYNILKRLNL